MALINVPVTNPTATALENNEAWKSPRANSARRAGITAVAENHKAKANTSQSASSATDGHLVWRWGIDNGNLIADVWAKMPLRHRTATKILVRVQIATEGGVNLNGTNQCRSPPKAA
jgi:hypothetical protein